MGAKIGGNDKLGVWGLGFGVVFWGYPQTPNSKPQTPNSKLFIIFATV